MTTHHQGAITLGLVARIQRLEIGELNERRVALGLERVEPEPFSHT